ncbi:MAG: hypothetical protein COB41_08685 [Proteobacteria bacterium]|nr:MAG: hypothetical protein COB41_08685 [Pseudomonadota bacterium]
MKKMIVMVFCILIGGGQSLAACVTTVTATTPTVDFVDYGNGTVTHTKTGLLWKQCSEGLSGAGCATGVVRLYNWQSALQAVQTFNAAGGFAGFTDWRIPNIKELNSIVENQCSNPAINASIFPATVNSAYWSSSPYAGTATKVWLVNFGGGTDFTDIKSGNYPVRLVRGGQ